MALEGRLTAVARRGVVGPLGFVDGEALGFVGVLSLSSSSGVGMACSFIPVNYLIQRLPPSAFYKPCCRKYEGM